MVKTHTTYFGYDQATLALNNRTVDLLAGYDAISIQQVSSLKLHDRQKPQIGFISRDYLDPDENETKGFQRKKFIPYFGSDGLFTGSGGNMKIKISNPTTAKIAFDQYCGMPGMSELRNFVDSLAPDADQKQLRKQKQIEDLEWFANQVENIECGGDIRWSGIITDKITGNKIKIADATLNFQPRFV